MKYDFPLMIVIDYGRRASSLLWVFLAGFICFSGCVSPQKPRSTEIVEEIRQEQTLTWEILDYRNKNFGEAIPGWLNSFLEGGIAAVEKLEEFDDYYVFITMNSGINLSVLEQWNAGFSPELDFARLVALRIEKRFLEAARTYPDDEYGSYFIAMIRSASDALWEGAVKGGDFWLRRRSSAAGETAGRRESYDFFILAKVEKTLLVPQVVTLLQNVRPEVPLSREQNAAVNRVRENFFSGF